jgi:hypothetical protein
MGENTIHLFCCFHYTEKSRGLQAKKTAQPESAGGEKHFELVWSLEGGGWSFDLSVTFA